MLEEICAKLKAKRQELGLTVEDAVEKTKLYPSAIRDIEEANLQNLSPVYLKGFIKIYASFLGVDLGDSLSQVSSAAKVKPSQPLIKKIVRDIKKQQPPQGVEEAGDFVDEFADEKTGQILKKLAVTVILGVILLIGLSALGRFIIKKLPRKARQPVSSAPARKVTASKDKKQKKAPPVKKSKQKVTSRQADKADSQEVAIPKINLPKDIATKDMVVSLTALRNCFVKVAIDGKLLFEGVLKKGLVESWKGRKEIELKISDGSAVYIELNGQSIPSLTTMRKPIKSLKITPAGISVDK